MNSEPQDNHRSSGARLGTRRAILSSGCFLPRCLPGSALRADPHMERAARLINKHKYSQQILEDSSVVRGIWPSAVGKAIARHTGALKVVRDSLIVEVEDATWQKQLHALRFQIVDRVQKLTGSTAIQTVEFRIGIPKRAPQRAETADGSASTGSRTPTGGQDEADLIQDPVLKKIYRLSRKRATA